MSEYKYDETSHLDADITPSTHPSSASGSEETDLEEGFSDRCHGKVHKNKSLKIWASVTCFLSVCSFAYALIWDRPGEYDPRSSSDAESNLDAGSNSSGVEDFFHDVEYDVESVLRKLEMLDRRDFPIHRDLKKFNASQFGPALNLTHATNPTPVGAGPVTEEEDGLLVVNRGNRTERLQDAPAGGAGGAGAAIGGGPGGPPVDNSPPPSAPGKPPPGSFEAKYGRARCGISIDQQVFNFADASVAIAGAVNSCDEANKTGKGAFDRDVCASDITSFLTDMAWWVSYLSLAPMWCGATQSGGCVSDAGWFAGLALSIMSDSFGAAGDCNQTNSTGPDEPVTPPRRLLDEKRRLRRSLNISEDTVIDSANCMIQINDAVSLSTKLGFATWATAHGCKAGGPGAVPGMLCSSNIINLVSFVPWIAHNVASIIGACPSIVRNETLPWAYCASDVLDMTAAVVSFGSWATTFTKDCHMVGK